MQKIHLPFLTRTRLFSARVANIFGAFATPGKAICNIPDVSADMMRLIIDYAYTYSIKVTEKNVEELLAAADWLCITGIVEACCNFLGGQLCTENCIGIWKFANFYYCPDLRQKAQGLIDAHFQEIVNGPGSEELMMLTLEDLVAIVEKDSLNVRGEDVVFDAIQRWIEHSPNDRTAYISILLPKVRLGFLKLDYFVTRVMNNTLVMSNADCTPIVVDALQIIHSKNLNGLDCNNPLMRPRCPAVILLAIGGWTSSLNSTLIIEAYDVNANCWFQKTSNHSPFSYLGTAYLHGFVYCVGGFVGNAGLNCVHKLELNTNTWHEVAPMHFNRYYVSVAILDSYIYAMGGFDGHLRHRSVERYDAVGNAWTIVASMHDRRSDASAAALNGKIYVCGGCNGRNFLCTAERYDPATNQWTRIAPMTAHRSGVGVIAYGEEIHAVGGFDGTRPLRSAEAYNPLTNTWRPLSSMSHVRTNFGIEVLDGFVYAVGGHDSVSAVATVERYDGRTDVWHQVCDMLMDCCGLSCCVVANVAPKN